MTVDSLQSLIADVERFLSNSSAPLSWSTSSIVVEREQTRQLLERVRAYLGTIEPQSFPPTQSASLLKTTEEKAVETVVQAVVAQINYHLADWFSSLRVELEGLRQQRQSLLNEIQHLQQQRQQIISEFIQLLMHSLQEALAQQLNETWGTLGSRLRPKSDLSISQNEIEPLLMNLDSNIRSVFESLERDLQKHYDSLSFGLERMHSLGQQGEAKLMAYLNRLSQQYTQTVEPITSSFNSQPRDSGPEQEIEVEEESPLAPPIKGEDLVDKIRLLTDLIDPLQVYSPILGEDGQRSPRMKNPPVPPIPLAPLNQQGGTGRAGKRQEDDSYLSVEPRRSNQSPDGWYLAIDWGTFTVAAVLSKVSSQATEGLTIVEHPLYWLGEQGANFTKSVIVSEKENLKSLLKYHSGEQQTIQSALSSLWENFIPSESEMTIKSEQLSPVSLKEALSQLSGVIISIPYGWEPICRFPLTNSLLETQLIQQPEQVYLVPEAIAALLGHLPLDDNNSPVNSPPTPGFPPISDQLVLMINFGATTTELALVNLPEHLQNLTLSDFTLSSLEYGGQELDQDIFCQLIYPQWASHLLPSLPQLGESLPQPGHPDGEKRRQLCQHLQSHPLGASLLEAAKLAKLILQQQDSFTSELLNQPFCLQRCALEEKVIRPFLLHLAEQINCLLAAGKTSLNMVGQVIVTGGTTFSLGDSLSDWLKKHFPQARLVHNNKQSERELNSPVAVGLACLPLFPSLFHTLRNR